MLVSHIYPLKFICEIEIYSKVTVLDPFTEGEKGLSWTMTLGTFVIKIK